MIISPFGTHLKPILFLVWHVLIMSEKKENAGLPQEDADGEELSNLLDSMFFWK